MELTPRLFHNDEDISVRPIWDLAVESDAWRQVFSEIDSNVGPPAASASAPLRAPAEPVTPPPPSY